MRALSPHEKRTVRIGGIAVLVYLLAFGGFHIWRSLSKHRSDYLRLVSEAQTLKEQTRVYEDRALVSKKLMEEFRMDPAMLTRATIVAQASASIQNAAKMGGVQVGPVREGTGRTSNKELATIQLEATGPIPKYDEIPARDGEHRLPALIDSMQIGSDPGKPGPLKMNLVIVILDFDQWIKKEAQNATS